MALNDYGDDTVVKSPYMNDPVTNPCIKVKRKQPSLLPGTSEIYKPRGMLRQNRHRELSTAD